MSDAAAPSDVRVEWLEVTGDIEVWRNLGLTVGADGSIPLFGTSLRVLHAGDGAPRGLSGWALSGVASDVGDIADLPTRIVPPSPPAFADHELGAVELDHVVVFTGDLEAVSERVHAATGHELRRIRELGTIRQGFHRIGRGGLIVEIVEQAGRAPTGGGEPLGRFWGLVVNVENLDAAAELLGPERLGKPKDAVQPGRRIATVREEVGLGVPVALMSRDPR